MRLINGVLQDLAWTKREALYILGDLDPAASPEWPRPNDAAGMGIDERVELCERILTEEPTERHHVVWLAFDRAVLVAHPGVTVGQVQFYEADLIRSAVAAGTAASPLPQELFGGRLTELDIPESNEIVLARVDLGLCIESDPARRAAAVAQSLVATALFRTGPFSFRLWSELDWSLDFVDGIFVGGSLFTRNEELPGSRLAYELVGTELASLAGSVVASSNPDKATLARFDALRWFHRAQNLEPSARLLLDVRILELIASSIRSTDPRWRKYLDNFWRDSWIRHSLLWAIFIAVRDAGRQSLIAARDVQPGGGPDIERLVTEVLKRRDAYRLQPNFPAAGAAVPELASLLSPYGMRGRRIRGLVSPIRDITALRTWVEATSGEWEALLDRTQRCRNALAHGGPINDRVMASASQFAHTLAAFAIGQEVQAIMSGRDLTSSHEELAKDAGGWRTGVAGGTTDVAGALEVRPDPPVA